MLIRDKHIDPSGILVRRALTIGLPTTQSLTNAPIWMWKIPHDLKMLGLGLYLRTYTATAAFTLHKANPTSLIIGGTLAIDATAEKFKLITKTAVYLVGGVAKSKAPATAIVFTLAHTVNVAAAAGTAHWGAIFVQINAAGTVSTKVITADQDYATEALAIAALPATPDTGNVQLGYITIQVKTGGRAWTANTDDMTAASDVTAANFYSTADSTTTIAGAITPVAASQVDGVLTAGNSNVDQDQYLVLLMTSDGSYVPTDSRLTLDYRGRGYRNGQ